MVKGIGVDIADVPRIKKMVDKGNRFIENVFTASEIEYCRSKHSESIHFAARFAAKEAFFKALGTGWRYGMRWDEICIVNDELGKPEIKISGKTQDFFREREMTTILLSLSHTKEYAVAFVVLE
jgi:holo-[acyl-carrier protein] synthase